MNKNLKELSKKYTSVNSLKNKIIELKGILHMPKSTEHYVSDIHGEYDSFSHVINNASGVIRGYIDELFTDSVSEEEKNALATLIYYPKEKLNIVKEELDKEEYSNWQRVSILRLIDITRRVASKYTHSKVREAYPEDFYDIIDELLFESSTNLHKGKYYNSLIDNIIDLDLGENYIVVFSKLIKRFSVETLYVIGDIFDRGKKADKVMDFLVSHNDAYVQWGNHDVAWIGASMGSAALIANVIRVAARYNDLDTIEAAYDVDLSQLKEFSEKTYNQSLCFIPKVPSSTDNLLLSKIHKAISIIQFKAEAQIIKRNPNYNLDQMIYLNKIDFKNKRVLVGEQYHMMKELDLPTIINGKELEYTPEEKQVINSLIQAFTNSKKLKTHVDFLIEKGSMYKISNGNLLFHGCIPLTENGEIKETNFLGKSLKGKALLDSVDSIVKEGYYKDTNKEYSMDLLWYLWCGPDSPLFGKDKITTFERYFLDNKKTHEEKRDPYYSLREFEKTADIILQDFGLSSDNSKIINGHTPVKQLKGENPVKANGKIVVIDGSFSKAYQKETGTSGYTLISNSYGLILATHSPLSSEQDIVKHNVDITSARTFVTKYPHRKRVRDTDLGIEILEKIENCETLINYYENTNNKI